MYYSLLKQRSVVLLLTMNMLSVDLTIEQVKEQNLESLRYVEEEFPDESYYEFLTRILDYQLHPHERKKRCLFFDFFSDDRAEHTTVSSVVSEQVWEDLLILNGRKKGDTFFARAVGSPITEIGAVVHYALLSRPVDDIACILQRQAAVKWLVEHPAVRTKLQSILSQLALHENGFIACWAHDGFKRASERCYYNTMVSCNSSAVLLQLKNLYDTAVNVGSVATNVLAAAFLSGYIVKRVGLTDALCPFEAYARSYQSAPGALSGTVTGCSDNSLFQVIATSFVINHCIKELKPDIEWTRDRMFIVWCVQQKMEQVARTVVLMKELGEIVQAHPELQKLVGELNSLVNLCHGTRLTAQERDLLASLERFTGQSALLRWGESLRIFSAVHDHKEILHDAYRSLGYLDAFCLAAELFDRPTGTTVRYSYAEFLERTTPYLSLIDFWNPLIDERSVVTNSLTLGGAEPRNIVVTGVNAGGKSNNLRAIVLNIMLAQTYGIVAASRAVMTLFSSILTSSNIGDDAVQGSSRFQAELLRMRLIVDEVKRCYENGIFSLALIDEPFSGTGHEAGAAATTTILEELAACETHSSLVTTHYREVSELAQKTGLFANYMVDAVVQCDGKVAYSFKLKPGISQQNIALELLKQSGM